MGLYLIINNENSQFELFEKPNVTKIMVSVSGGRTSCYMAWWMLNNRNIVAGKLGIKEHDLEFIFCFANTGMEHEDTLRFMNDVDINFGLNCVWLEGYVTSGKKVGTKHRIVSYDSAFRVDQWQEPMHPYTNHITKYGVPNVSYKNCSRDMKEYTIKSYLRSLGLTEKKHFYTALGIRDDEAVKRKSTNPGRRGLIYPFIDWLPLSKSDVLEWWSQYSWDLKIPEAFGNCISCFKKCDSKLALAYHAMPEVFEFNRYMEEHYSRVGSEFEKHNDRDSRVFFRGNRSTDQLIEGFIL